MKRFREDREAAYQRGDQDEWQLETGDDGAARGDDQPILNARTRQRAHPQGGPTPARPASPRARQGPHDTDRSRIQPPASKDHRNERGEWRPSQAGGDVDAAQSPRRAAVEREGSRRTRRRIAAARAAEAPLECRSVSSSHDCKYGDDPERRRRRVIV